MFEDLNWRWAARRAAVVVGLYVALLYVFNTISPGTFPFDISLLVVVPLFFLMFTFVYAYVDRSRRRRLAEMQKRSKQARPAGDPEDEPGELKGRPNPNTSRKKARRRR